MSGSRKRKNNRSDTMDLKKWVRRRVVAVQERFQRDCLKAQERAQKAAQKKKQQEKRKTKVMRKKIRLALGGTGVVGEINPAESRRQGRPVINTPRRKTIRRKELGSLYRPLILTSEDIRREVASERARRRKEREREEDFIHPKIQ